jgi:hypothetical protein
MQGIPLPYRPMPLDDVRLALWRDADGSAS